MDAGLSESEAAAQWILAYAIFLFFFRFFTRNIHIMFSLSYNYVTVSAFGEPSCHLSWNVRLKALALSFYEYLITLHLEMSEIWRGKLSITKVLFYLSRYPYLVFQVLSMLLLFGQFSDYVCISLLCIIFYGLTRLSRGELTNNAKRFLQLSRIY